MITHESLDELYADAWSHQTEPLWTAYESISPSDPQPRAVPFTWPYRKLRPLLERAGALIGTDKAERRVLMLVNPGIGRSPYTTDTLFAGLQCILPGEVARAHRHLAFALRFIIEGTRGFTAVGGQKVTMSPGDVILTPTWEYHDHGNEGDAPMIWLDGLDIPLYQFLPVHFTRRYAEPRYPSVPAPTPSRLLYPWAEMQATLDAQPGPFGMALYRDRDTGGPIARTLGAQAERIDGGTRSPYRRETASAVYHVRAGRGRTRVGHETIAWETHDTFAVPAWRPYEHENLGDEPAYLFRFDDSTLLEAIGAYHHEGSGTVA